MKEQEGRGMTAAVQPKRIVDPDGAEVDVFALPTDESNLLALLRDIFERHWLDVTFGPIVQGAAWEMRATAPPAHIGLLDGYLTVVFGHSHFHLCIGETKGSRRNPTPEVLAHHRRTARAELYRQIGAGGAPVSWGLRLFNGAGEQQITILLPNPFLSADGDKILEEPDWSRLALWDGLRSRWLGLADPDPIDRSGRAFRHA